MKPISIFILILLCISGCTQRQEPVAPPWGIASDSTDAFDLDDIQQAGELIGLTLSGPDTYYDYHGHHLGVQYMLAEKFANNLGVKLRVEVCRDTAEIYDRINGNEADFAFMRFDRDTTVAGWLVAEGKTALAEELAAWYRPEMTAEAKAEEHEWLTGGMIERHVYAPMLSQGAISRYDLYFRTYGRRIGWDWRLLAALCYQESTFDPRARSFAGAQGLMQIMPSTADRLGLPADKMYDPEHNIEAGTRYLKQLERELSDVGDRVERQNLAMAAYNGGLNHIRDAMRLARRDGRNPHRWSDVKVYVLRLSEPRYYQDSLVRSGYMRGSETAQYVDDIRARFKKYKRSVR